ncbi:MAG: ACP S-malonyltransferase [Bauldia sp.]|nr:ACP S-malonyltransferase [Bauldia sp.]
MTTALVFPGQGSQAVGMGKALAEAYPAARAVFDEVDDALGEKLSSLIFEGPIETLTLTQNTQPALMAVSLAVMRVLAAEGFRVADRVAFVAGHSLGEYSALAAAGSLTVSEAARLLQIRGRAMQSAVPPGEGAMAAILGLDFEAVKEIAEAASAGPGSVDVANDNGGNQVVVSGHKASVEKAGELATERGAKRVVMLAVSAPFHSRLMAPAAIVMRDALAAATVAPPAVPLVANVTASPVSEPDEIRRRLVEQVTGMVRWRESVAWMAENGVDRFVEIGAGKVLSGLNKRIAAGAASTSVGTPADIAEFLKTTA